MRYTYLGDRLTCPTLRGMQCDPVKRNGKCIRSRAATMLVIDAAGRRHVVLARLLRINAKLRAKESNHGQE